MSEIAEVFLRKAAESLAGAESELVNGRYNNAANRAYYACFQAAVVALDAAGIRPAGASEQWSHRYVQAKFPALISRRKTYSGEVRSTLGQLLTLRERADYKVIGVSQKQAFRAVARPRFRRRHCGTWGDDRMSIYLDVPVDVNEPHIQEAVTELQSLIAARYPDAVFTVTRGDDPEGIYLNAAVDTDDLDDVVDVVLARMVELNELGLPIYVIPTWPMERIRSHLRREAKVPIEAR